MNREGAENAEKIPERTLRPLWLEKKIYRQSDIFSLV